MRSIASLAIFLALIFEVEASTRPGQNQKQPGAIAGRVLVDGKPAQGVMVIAKPDMSAPSKAMDRLLKGSADPRATTDSEGRYRIEGLAPGQYDIGAASPLLVSSNPDGSGQDVTVAEGATIENVDFSLVRGGVITGKVTDSEGQPVINELITLKTAGSKEPPIGAAALGSRMYFTDDRGVFRIFGIRPGQYIVSTGSSQESVFEMFLKRPKRARTYYPGVPDEPRAKPVEVTAGAEVSAVDIKIPAADKGFTVNGRVIDAETRAPVVDAMVTYSKRDAEAGTQVTVGNSSISFPGAFTTTNARGEFRFESVAPGTYKVEASSIGALTGVGGFFADPINLDVQYANVDRLEVRIHRGASISGVVVVENPTAAAALNELSQLMLLASTTDVQMKPSVSGVVRLSADGSFLISGLKPGKTKLSTAPYGEQKFSVLRIEHNGVEQHDGIDVQTNAQITGVRVVVVAADCSIRGHVTLEGAALPSGATVWVSARRAGASNDVLGYSPTVTADANGDFVIENLAPGSYEVTAHIGSVPKRSGSASQTVTVISGVPGEVTLSLILNSKNNDR